MSPTEPEAERAEARRRAEGLAGVASDPVPLAEPGPSPGVDALLRRAVEEAARLLDADGAFLYLLDPDDGKLRFRYDAGLRELAPDSPLRRLELEVGVGMFGKAVAERRVVVTGAYESDRSFIHASGPDRFVDEVGIRSLVVAPLVAGDEVFGSLGTFSRMPDAFSPPQIALVRALADHAALAMANARLIEELDRSRAAIARRADIERALRELGTRISGAPDPDAVVQDTVDEACRLLRGDGARIDLADHAARQLRGIYSSGAEVITEDQWPADPNDSVEIGVSGRAFLTGRSFWTPDYLADERIVHSIGPDTYVRSKKIHSVIAAPLFGSNGAIGALTVWSRRRGQFGEDDAALLETIAGQAAVALGRARLIEELGRSQETLARRADEEHSLREIGARLATIGDDPAEVLQRIVDEAARLLGAERARLDLVEPTAGRRRYRSYPAGEDSSDSWIPPGHADYRAVGLSALAAESGRAVTTPDYAADHRFAHYPEGDAEVSELGLRSLIATPVSGEAGLLGMLQLGSRELDAFGDDHVRLIDSLAGQAAIAIRNARLVDRLAGSQAELASAVEAEHALREIAGRMMTIQDPADLLRQVVAEAARLMGPSGAVIDLLDPATGQISWAHDAGVDPAIREAWTTRGVGDSGVFTAIRERRVVVSDDYGADERFADGPPNAAFLREMHVRAVAFAPLVGEAAVLGTLSVFSDRVRAFGDAEAERIGALASQAAIAIRNAELIRALGRSREETARRADTERTLREIAARITSIRDPEAILGLIVDEAQRILESDGAHLTRLSEDRTFLRPVVVAGGQDEETRAWLRTQEFPLHGGINGLAAGQGRLVWTPDYVTDPRIPREADDLEVAARMSLGAMAAAPLRASGGDVIGTLAVSYREPGPITGERLAILQALADNAAIALSNSDLLSRLEASEGSYRRLVQATPDVIWRNDAEGRFTFLAERAEGLFGWRAEELVGAHFADIVAPGSLDESARAWAELANAPDRFWRLRFRMRRKDGSTFPAEVSAVSIFEDGRFVGGQGTLRDVSERERLEHELRDSEERYRSLVQSSPDLIWATNRQGRYVFVSDRVQNLLGWAPDDILGRHFTEFVAPSSREAVLAERDRLSREPNRPQTQRLDLVHRDGTHRPFEVSTVAITRDGELEAIYGIARDVTERERLERELRESEERYRFLVENSPEIVYATDGEGRFTYVSDSIEKSLGWAPAHFVGRHFRDLVVPRGPDPVGQSFRKLEEDPTGDLAVRMQLRAADGTAHPFDVSAVAIVRDGAFAGVHGSARDVGERERLEHELRDSEERYRYLVQSSPDLVWMTDQEGRFTFISDQARAIVGWDPLELIGRSFEELAPPDERRSTRARFRMLQRRPTTVHRSRITILHRDERPLTMEITGIGMLDDERFAGAHGAARDVSERERLERDLRRQAAELAASEERSHLARELHDSVTQALFSMTLLSRSIEILLGRDPAQVPEKLVALRELQRDALAEMRALIFELRPGNIEEHGLIQSLRTHVAALSGRIGLPVVVEADLPERPSIEVEQTLYRIAQEALHNVVKHAGAHEVRVEVGRVPDGVRLRVSDDGRGFDPAGIAAGSLGLAGMRARAERLGGCLEVRSAPGVGTAIEVVVPVRVPSAPAAAADVTAASESPRLGEVAAPVQADDPGEPGAQVESDHDN